MTQEQLELLMSEVKRHNTALETIAAKLYDANVNDRLARIECRQDEFIAWGNNLMSYIDQRLTPNQQPINVVEQTEQNKPQSKVRITEQDVLDTIMNATQFKGEQGFKRADIASIIQAARGLDKLSEYNQQVITHSLKALCDKGKIRWNGKKTKAAIYYVQ